MLASLISGATAASLPTIGGRHAFLPKELTGCTGHEAIPFYTAAQRTNTVAFLTEFRNTIPSLSKTWISCNLCHWDGVHCSTAGVEVLLDSRRLVGRLPEVPVFVDAAQVMMTRFAIEGEGDGIAHELPDSWRSLDQLTSLEIRLDLNLRAPQVREAPNTVYRMKARADTTSDTNADGCALPRNVLNVSLANNRMSGPLPPSLPRCNPRIKYLYLQNNTGLSGPIPKEWGNWTSLQVINLELTDVCGCPPQEWAKVNPPVIVKAEAQVNDPDLCKTSCSGSSGSSGLECDGPIPFYTVNQQVNTRHFLEAFTHTLQDLQPLWTCTNFCVWDYVRCTPAGVEVEITRTEFFGYVPEVPANVDPSEVVVTKLEFHQSRWVEGDYPPSWALLPSLQYISFAYTSMSGTLPSEWGTMSALRYLDLSFTLTGGMFPDIWSNLANLEVLKLVRLTISGQLPSSWSRMASLRELDLDRTSASGTLPPSWGALKNLELLSLPYNNLVGSLPTTWSSLKRLETLLLQHNQLSGSIPEEYNDMVSIRHVNLIVNNFCGCLPSNWAANPNQTITITADEKLIASDCATTNACQTSSDSSAGSSSSSADECYGPVPFYSAAQQEHTRRLLEAFMESIPALREIWVCPNFCAWPYVQCASIGLALEMAGAPIAGSLPPVPPSVDVKEIVVIRVDVSGVTDIGDQLPPSWASLVSMQHIAIRGTLIFGSLPTEWSRMPRLKYLDAGGTMITGQLPSSWSSLEHLEVLRVDDAMLSGTLPDSWSGMNSLKELNLGWNTLDGTLPASWSRLDTLQSIQLHHNHLSGTLPESWSALLLMKHFRVDENQLIGKIPESYSDWHVLAHAQLEMNKFCGCLPSRWVAEGGVSMTVTANPPVMTADCATANACEEPPTSPPSSSAASSSSSSSSSSASTNVPTPGPILPSSSSSVSSLDTAFYDKLSIYCPNAEEAGVEVIESHKGDICCSSWNGSDYNTSCGDEIGGFSDTVVTCSGALGSRGYFSCCSKVGADGTGEFLGTRCKENAAVAPATFWRSGTSGADCVLWAMAAVLGIALL
ncbi:hypothetical protein LSCM1_00809 [Leishmania martiniquensis]|uniref:Proteophosphoglycan ppg4 n=1 Tax=Leishmania martiniquensis TaxID=1580590 RepID=A0A836KDB2_9TRYP|nr:hypothetical protein LSCM1_00809 [Leishmania martiniquensis]